MNIKDLKTKVFYKDFIYAIDGIDISLMEFLVYGWQQQTHGFLKLTPIKYLDYFLSNFTEKKPCKLYRAVILRHRKEEEWEEFVAATKDLDIARDILNFNDNATRLIYEVEAEKYFDCSTYKFTDMGESEVILYKPIALKLLEVRIDY